LVATRAGLAEKRWKCSINGRRFKFTRISANAVRVCSVFMSVAWFYQDVGADGVEVAAGARVEGEDPAAGRGERKRDARTAVGGGC
jgi:hypothetical protein